MNLTPNQKKALIYLAVGVAWAGTVTVVNTKKGRSNRLKDRVIDLLAWPISFPSFIWGKLSKKRLSGAERGRLG